MALPVIPIIIVFFAFLIIYFHIRSYRQSLKLKKSSALAETQLAREIEKNNAITIELTELKEKFNQNVLFDSLTNLPGRKVFSDRLEQTLNQSKRYQLIFGVLFLDIDGFKMVNDALGHDAGDILLIEVAKRLQESIRHVDSVSRYAADEFVLILSQLSRPETAAYVGQRLLNAMSQPFKVRDQEIFITVSIGIATYPGDGEDAVTLMKNADNALHQAKARGRNTFQFYRSEMHTLSQRELILSSCLQNPEIYQDFMLYYQPQVNIKTRQIVSMQALLRWQHPDFGTIGLAEFVHLAENNNKILEIGEWMMQKAFQQFMKWKQSDLHTNSITISVSSRQLENSRFIYRLSQILQELNMDPSNLVLEVSEKAISVKLDLIEKMFNMLKHLGVQVVIKDFGTGNLSLQNLKRFRVDHLKIASLLVKDVTINKESEIIIKMILAIGQTLQIDVTAESVDTQKQKQFLDELGCFIMQGALFCSPILADELTPEKLSLLVAQ